MKQYIKKHLSHAWRQNKPLLLITASILLLFIGIIGFHVVKSIMIRVFFSHYSPPPVTVSSAQAKARTWQPQIQAIGNFLATQGVEVNAQAAGNVTSIHFESGQFVQEGQALIDIDDRLEQAVLKHNQAQLVLANLNFNRQSDLNKRGASPMSSVDEAKAKLTQAQSDVERTQVQIQQKHVTAPFSGKLGIRKINLGQYISQGQTTIVTLQSLDPLYLEFYVPEQQLKRLYPHQPVVFTVDAYPNLLFSGKINAINSKIDPQTHNVLVQAQLPNCPTDLFKHSAQFPWIKAYKKPNHHETLITCDTQNNKTHNISNFMFIPGMFAALTIEEKRTLHVIVVPSTAISYSLYGDSVFRIEKDQSAKTNPDGKTNLIAKRIFVKTGEQQGNDTVILEGLKAGDTIVSVGEIKLQNGAAVVIDNTIQLNTSPHLQTLSP